MKKMYPPPAMVVSNDALRTPSEIPLPEAGMARSYVIRIDAKMDMPKTTRPCMAPSILRVTPASAVATRAPTYKAIIERITIQKPSPTGIPVRGRGAFGFALLAKIASPSAPNVAQTLSAANVPAKIAPHAVFEGALTGRLVR